MNVDNYIAAQGAVLDQGNMELRSIIDEMDLAALIMVYESLRDRVAKNPKDAMRTIARCRNVTLFGSLVVNGLADHIQRRLDAGERPS